MHRERIHELVGGASIVLVEGPAGSGKTELGEALLRSVADASGQAPVRRRGSAAGSTDLDDRAPLLLDDAHLLPPDAAATWLDTIERRSGPTIVCGRRLTAFGVLAFRSDTRVVGWDDLAVTIDDLEPLVGSRGVAADIVSACAGWPAVVDECVARLGGEPTWNPSRGGAVAAIVRRLVDDSIGEDVQAASDLARLPLLDDVLVPEHLLGVVPMRRIGRWWSTLPPIAEAIGVGAWSAERAVRASRHYLDSGEVRAAADLMIDVNEPAATLEAFAGATAPTLATLDTWQLRQLIGALAPTVDSAGLLLQASRAAERVDRHSWAAWLEAACQSGVGVDTALGRAVLVDKARHRMRSGDVSGGAADAAALVDSIPDTEPQTLARAQVVIAMSEVYECTPASLAVAVERYRTAVTLFRRARDLHGRTDALARLGYQALFLGGHAAEGQRAMEDALALLPAGDWTRGYWLAMYSDVLDFLGRVIEAEAAASECIEIGERLDDHAIIGMGWWQRSWLASHRRDKQAFQRAVAAVERHRGEWLTLGQELEFLASTAERSLLVGDLAGYERMIERARTLGDEIGMTEPVHLAELWYEATLGDAAQASTSLEHIEMTPAVVPMHRSRRLLLRAVAEMRLGNADVARELAAESLVAATELGVPDIHHRQHSGLLEQLQPILDRDAGVGARLDSASSVQLRLLGRFAFDDPELGHRTPQAGHPATLVKLLALNGSMSTEVAIDRLWPDADAPTGRARLRNLLNRLKQHTGSIVVRDAETLRLDDSITVDAAVFEQAAVEALAAEPDERVGRARHALALYAGDLLPGDTYEDWASSHRARLQRRVVALADLVADDAESRRDVDDAVRWLDVAIDIEPLDERRTIRLCELLKSAGRDVSAARVAQRCNALLDELGLPPSGVLATYAALAPDTEPG